MCNTNGAIGFPKIERICIHSVIQILQFIVNPYGALFRENRVSFFGFLRCMNEFNIARNEKGVELFQ